MLRGAYSHTNYFNKLFILIALVFSLLLFSTLFGILILVPFYGSGILGLLTTPDYSDASVISAMKVIQILNMAGGLLLPALIYLWLCTPVDESIKKNGRNTAPLAVLWSVILIVIAQPLIGFANEVNSFLQLPQWLSFVEEWMKNAERQGELITDAFLSTTTASGLLLNIFMIAVLPAFTEEFLFRGVLARLFSDWTKSKHLAVFISSLIFAAIHLQFYGFLPRFLLGMAMGYLFFWSGSLWLPITAHFTNNFLSVMVEFLYRRGLTGTNAESFGLDNAAWMTGISIVSVSFMMYYIHRITTVQPVK